MIEAELRKLAIDERDLGIAFYESQAYHGGIATGDIALGAWQGTRLVGLVRLAEEQGVHLLRGMFIDASCQRTGLGTRMLTALARDMVHAYWLVCPDRLNGFYGIVGFEPVSPDRCPVHLIERAAKYQAVARGTMNVLRRPGAASS